MSGRIDELERLLDLADCDGECHRCDHGACEAIGNLPGFTDTLRALVDVAKAAQTFVLSGKYDADFDVTRYSDSTRLCLNAVLDQLFPAEETLSPEAHNVPVSGTEGTVGRRRTGGSGMSSDIGCSLDDIRNTRAALVAYRKERGL